MTLSLAEMGRICAEAIAAGELPSVDEWGRYRAAGSPPLPPYEPPSRPRVVTRPPPYTPEQLMASEDTVDVPDGRLMASTPVGIIGRRSLPAYRTTECEHLGPAATCRVASCRYSLLPDRVDPSQHVPCALAHADEPMEWDEIAALFGLTRSRIRQIADSALAKPHIARWLAQVGRALDISEADIQRVLERTSRKSERSIRERQKARRAQQRGK